MRSSDGTAIVAKRAAEPPVEVEEIRALARAAGYEVADSITQTRPEDPGTYLGSGAVEDVADRVAEAGAELLIVDDQLTPSQHYQLETAMPEQTRVQDRYRLVLEIFADGASTRRARLQVELARLQYDLPRIRERADEGLLNRRTEKGSPLYDVEDRIDELQRKLDELPTPADEFRQRRREEGFDLVTLAGYTNAGKSTLLHRLADELDLSDATPDHPDRTPVASIDDQLFETLQTTTRRATLAGRPTLLTDTVGLVDDLPHWLVESFSETLSEAAAADVVLLVVDASDPPTELRRKLRTSLEVLRAQDVDPDDVVTAMNKVDLLDPPERAHRLSIAEDLAPTPLPVSATDGRHVDDLRAELVATLPTETATLELPNCDEAMRLVSEAYDSVAVEDVAYDEDTVTVTARGRPAVIDRLRRTADGMSARAH